MCPEGENRSSMPDKLVPFRAMEDRDLVIAFKAGDPDAYDEMYRRYSARVGGVCRRMLTNREDAQEAVQETFLKAYLALPEFNGNYRLGAWLGRIASNVCVDQLRARARSASLVPLQADAGVLAVESSPRTSCRRRSRGGRADGRDAAASCARARPARCPGHVPPRDCRSIVDDARTGEGSLASSAAIL